MGKFKRVLVLEVEIAKDKNPETEGGKYRRDTPWLVEAFKKKGVESEILFITNKDTAATLKAKYPDTAFLGRVNPMDYPTISLNEYVKMLKDFKKDGLLLGPDAEHMDRLGSKMILYELKDSGMGVSNTLLHAYDDLKKNQGEIDRIIPKDGPPRVLKMMRGSTGLGVWKLENKGDKILMTDAYTQTTEEIARQDVIPKFLALCQEDAISMPFLPLIKDGEFRFSHVQAQNHRGCSQEAGGRVGIHGHAAIRCCIHDPGSERAQADGRRGRSMVPRSEEDLQHG